MANRIEYDYQATNIIKDYGVTTLAEQELFKDKYEGCKYIHGGCLNANNNCEFIGDDGNGNISHIKLKGGETFEFFDIVPWVSLKIKSTVGTEFNCSFDC